MAFLRGLPCRRPARCTPKTPPPLRRRRASCSIRQRSPAGSTSAWSRRCCTWARPGLGLAALLLLAGSGAARPADTECRHAQVGPGQGVWEALGLPCGGGVLKGVCVSLSATPGNWGADGAPPPPPPGGPIRVATGAHLSIRGLTFVGAAAGAGHPVFEVDGGTLVVSDSIFRQHTSTPVRVRAGFLTCTNCSFVDNGARGAEHSDSSEVDAERGMGGGIQALGGQVTLARSVFVNNWASSGGGALYAAGSQVLIFKCIFDSNACGHGEADGEWSSALPEPCGGALLIEHDADKAPTTVSIRVSSLRRNRALSGGAACVRVRRGVLLGTCSHAREDATSRDLPGPAGDLLEAYNALVNFSDTSFEGNRAIRRGGGIAFEDSVGACAGRAAPEKLLGASRGLHIR